MMSPPSPNSIRFVVEPRLVPAHKAARRLHLTEAEFRGKLDALLRVGFPAACSITGHYDLKAIDEWLDKRSGVGTAAGKPIDARTISKEEFQAKLDAAFGPRRTSQGEAERLVPAIAFALRLRLDDLAPRE
jgi:hypothetical protein